MCPVYEYCCEICKREIEITQKIDDPPPKCCQKNMKKNISLSSFVLRGSGWSKDGYSKRSK